MQHGHKHVKGFRGNDSHFWRKVNYKVSIGFKSLFISKINLTGDSKYLGRTVYLRDELSVSIGQLIRFFLFILFNENNIVNMSHHHI